MVREAIMLGQLKHARYGIFLLALLLALASRPATAGDTIISNNSGADNQVFVIEGEPSLVINGFDLSPLGISFPTALDAVTIFVDSAVPGAPVELLIYEDANGGSPVDATLVHRQPVAINSAGANRILLEQAAIVTEPVVWVGFYLPVDFRFFADTSGSSVLTYWAWTAGGSFDLSALSSAQVLGPGDGTEPVGISMDGIARITAELRTPDYQETREADLVGKQFVDSLAQDTSVLQPYQYCGDLLYDPEDIDISGSGAFSIECGVNREFEAPTALVQPSGAELDVQRAGHLFKLVARIPEQLHAEGAVGTLPVPVTHCIRVQALDLEQAIIAEARDIPERWYVLPSVRFGDLVCVEVTHASYLSYFLPRAQDSPQNVNLVLGWSRITPHPLECGILTGFQVPVVNTGQSWFDTPSSDVKVIVENVHVRTGVVTVARELKVPTSQLGPGMRSVLEIGPMIVDTYVHELHRIQIRLDFDEKVEETNEFDNTWNSEYVLQWAGGSQRCYDRDWLTSTPYPSTSLDYCFIGRPYSTSGNKILIPYSPACDIEFRSGHVEARPGAGEPRMFKKGDCHIAISIDVVDQSAKILYRKIDVQDSPCPGSSRVRDYIDTDELVLVIDIDGA